MRVKNSPNAVDPALLPSVDEMLSQTAASDLVTELGRERVVGMVRSLISERRSKLLDGTGLASDRASLISLLTEDLTALANTERLSGVRRVINATGVVIHTNLGRAPLSDHAFEAMKDAAGYSTIEYDLGKGARGARGAKAVELLKLLTGGEDALVVNNCAAAALLVLSVFAQGREVIVSRGELVEIGGDFRVPDILARSGAVLREVGTTNRTHLRDFENAISEKTAMILKVHPSNFRITGFTKTSETAELAELARGRSIIFYEDAGSGALFDLSSIGIKGEPVVRDVLASGADLVSFSADKLLGGPQAGVIAGRADMIERLRRDPFYRALRLDKTITAALEATLETYARNNAEREIPVLRMLTASPEQIAARSEAFIQKMNGVSDANGLQAKLVKRRSAVGGGAAPDSALETTVITLSHPGMSDSELEQRLRRWDPPIIARIETGQVLIDLRTVNRDEEDMVIKAMASFSTNDAKEEDETHELISESV